MSKNISAGQAALLIVIVALVQLILQLSLLAKGTEYIAGSLAIDDTYYYLQTAWNAKTLGFVTFDGLHSTNGVQLLWFVIIYLLAILAKSKTILLFSTLAVSFLFNALCYLIILKIGAILKQPVLALLMSGLWALQCLPFRIYSMGMENSLHALVFWCVIWQSVDFLINVQNKEKPDFLRLTVVLILAVWTRLDSALIVTVLFTFCVGMLAYLHRDNLRLFFQRYGKVIAASSLLAGFGLIVQLTAFWLMGNSFLPVSALVKTSGAARGFSSAAIEKFVEVLMLGMTSILPDRFSTPMLILLGIFSILFVSIARKARPYQTGELQAFLNLWSILLVGELLYHTYIAVSGVQYAVYFSWYRSPSFIFWIITGSLVVFLAIEQFQRIQPTWASLRWVPVGLTLLSVMVAIYLFARRINFTSTLYVTRYNAALWIAENSPPDTIFAAWNTGQLGYFSDRTFINLDGVINSVDYYERVLHGTVSLTDYLFEKKVDYIVDYATYDAIPAFPVVQTFPLDDDSGRSIHIWQVSPEFSTTR